MQVVLFSLIGCEQVSTVKGQTVQDNYHLVFLSIENVDTKVALINLNQCRALDKDDYHFMVTVLVYTGFRP